MRRVVHCITVALLLAAPAALATPFIGPPDGPGAYWGAHHNDYGSPFAGFKPWMTQRDAELLCDLAGADEATRTVILDQIRSHIEWIDERQARWREVDWGDEPHDENEAKAYWQRIDDERHALWEVERDALNERLRDALGPAHAVAVDRYARLRADEHRFLNQVSDHPLLVLATVAPPPAKDSALERLSRQLERELAPAVRDIIDADYIDIASGGWDTYEESKAKLEQEIEVRRFVMTWTNRIAKRLDDDTARRYIRAVRLSQFETEWDRAPGLRGFAENMQWQARIVYADLPEMLDLLKSVDALVSEHWQRMPELRDQIDDAFIRRLEAEEAHGRNHHAYNAAYEAVGPLYDQLYALDGLIVDAYVEAGIINRVTEPDGSSRIDVPEAGYEAHQQQERVLGIPITLDSPTESP